MGSQQTKTQLQVSSSFYEIKQNHTSPFKNYHRKIRTKYCSNINITSTSEPKLGTAPMPAFRVVPYSVVSAHTNPVRNGAILPHLLRELLLDHERLVWRHGWRLKKSRRWVEDLRNWNERRWETLEMWRNSEGVKYVGFWTMKSTLS